MAFLGDTGQGALFTMVGLSLVSRVKSIQLPEFTQEKIDATSLNTSGFMQYIAGDVIDPGEMTLELIFDPEDDLTPLTVMGGCGEEVEVEFPKSPCRDTTIGVNAATLAGTAIITSVAFPNLAVNELMMVTLTVAFDGGTGPTYTPEQVPPPA